MRVLIIDDDENPRLLLMRIVKYTGYEALGYASGRDALHYLRTHNEYPNLILVDVMMPDMSGWDVLYDLGNSSHLATIPVVMISAGGDYMQQALKRGAVNFLPKPFDIETVKRIVKQYCTSSGVTDQRSTQLLQDASRTLG